MPAQLTQDTPSNGTSLRRPVQISRWVLPHVSRQNRLLANAGRLMNLLKLVPFVCLTDAHKDSLSLGEKTSSDGGQDHPPSVSFATDFDVLRHFEFRDEFLAQQLSWICISIRALLQWRINRTFSDSAGAVSLASVTNLRRLPSKLWV